MSERNPKLNYTSGLIIFSIQPVFALFCSEVEAKMQNVVLILANSLSFIDWYLILDCVASFIPNVWTLHFHLHYLWSGYHIIFLVLMQHHPSTLPSLLSFSLYILQLELFFKMKTRVCHPIVKTLTRYQCY